MTAAAGGRYIVISTQGVADRLLNKPTPKQGKLFVLDTSTDKIVREIEPVPAAACTGHVVGVGGARVLGITPDPDDVSATILYGVDVGTGAVQFRKRIPFAMDWRTMHLKHGGDMFDFRMGPDGHVWTYMGPALVRIDPANAEVLPVGHIRLGGRIAFSGDDVYFAGEVTLRKEPGLLRKLRQAGTGM